MRKKNTYEKHGPCLAQEKDRIVFQKPNPFPKSITITSLWAEYSIKDKKKLTTIGKSKALWNEVKDRLHESAMVLSAGQLSNAYA